MGDMREWWEKHAPRASKDLCVAPKKVAEVRDWLRSRVPSLRADHGNHGGGVVVGSGRVLLLTGPTGCGKSTAVELLCAELGLRLLRWSAPTPTLWHEHAYQGDLAAGYVSKQREFEEFLSRSTIMSQIPLGPSGSGGGGGGGLAFGKSVRAGGTVVLIDDLPATNGFQKHQELVDSLRRFCGSSRHPVVLCLSTIHKQDARDNQGYYQDRVVRSLELSTECKVCTFPAVTAPRIAKVLERASESENHYVDRQALSSIAESSNGDVRNALCTLQFRLVGETREEGVGAVRAKRKRKRKGEVEKRAGAGGGMAPPPPSGGAGPCSRDRELDRFHVLGKILYNKRTEEGLPENDAEEIVRMSHLDAPQLLSWVHENFPDFLGEDAIEECDRISAYLSDAAALMEDGETLPPSLFASLPVADFPPLSLFRCDGRFGLRGDPILPGGCDGVPVRQGHQTQQEPWIPPDAPAAGVRRGQGQDHEPDRAAVHLCTEVARVQDPGAQGDADRGGPPLLESAGLRRRAGWGSNSRPEHHAKGVAHPGVLQGDVQDGLREGGGRGRGRGEASYGGRWRGPAGGGRRDRGGVNQRRE